MVLGRVLARGQLTLPREIRRAADLQPGDRVTFRVTGSGVVEIRALPRLTLSEALERFVIEEPIDPAEAAEAWKEAAAEEALGAGRSPTARPPRTGPPRARQS